MVESPQSTPPSRWHAWTYALCVGLTLGTVGYGVRKALLPSLGYWGAGALGFVAAVLAGATVALIVKRVIGPR